MVSIRADPPQQEHLLRLIRTHRATIQEGINRHLRLRYTPRLTFHLDPSLAEGDRLLHLLSSLEAEAPPEEE
jgi:ribosome-binding factor A